MIVTIVSSGGKPDTPSVVTGATKLGTVAATGGTKTTITSGGTQWSLHQFNSTGVINFSSGGPIEYIIVGGGGGGAEGGTGAGAGAVVTGTTTVAPGNYTITVGAGGGGQEAWWYYGNTVTNGYPSSAFSQSAGGGQSGGNSGNGRTPGATAGPSGFSNTVSGGGAGSAANGNPGSLPRQGGSGGSGDDISIFLGQSASTTYKGGGGGGSGFWANDWGAESILGGAGGIGGGGLSPGVGAVGGGYVIPQTARGETNSGGGGATAAGRMGQPADGGARGANGGSGIVYVRYALSSQTTAEVGFVEPTFKGKSGVARYRVKSNNNVQTLGDYSPIEVTGLTPGQNYNFTVTTVADSGIESDESTASNTFQLGIAPGAPTIGTATAGNSAGNYNRATVSFTAGTSGTGTTTYTATSIPSGFTASNTTGDPITVTGLSVGVSYTFTVTASNSFGANTSGQSNSIVANGTPPAPVLNSVSAQYSRASLSWSSAAGATSYTAYAVAGGYATRSATTSGTSVTISSLSTNVTYTFYVVASNAAGSSGNSNSLTEFTDVPCPGGTFINQVQYGGSEPGQVCTYNRVCDGDGGIVNQYASGGCSVYCPQGAAYGPYCAGCTPGCCENAC